MAMAFSVGNKIAGMFLRAKALLPGYRRAAKELAERQQLELEFADFKSKMAIWGVAFTVLILVLVLGMVILLRWWGKHQAYRESALVHTVEESRAETATVKEKTTRVEAQRDTARSACYDFQLAVVENRADSHRADAESARVKTELQTKTKLFKRTEAEKQTARSACYEYQLEGIQNRQDAYRARIALAQAEHDLQKMAEVVARFKVQTQLQGLGMRSLNAALVKEEGKTEKAERDLATCRAEYEECRSSLQSAREQMARESAQVEAVEEAARKAATQGKETGPQAQQQQVPEGSHASTASDAELDEEGFCLKHMEEAMLRSVEESKQEGGRDPQQGKASSAPWAKAIAAPAASSPMVPKARRRREKKKEPPPTASANRWAVFAEDEDDDDEDEGVTPADATPVTSPPRRGRTRGKSPSPSRRRANNEREDP